jgi:hypothetical protein
MCCNRGLDVLEIQYFNFFLSARCIRIWSAQRFYLCSLSQYIFVFLHVHKFFRVSGLGISARARGNFMHNNILRHTSEQFALRWAGT